MTPEPRPGPTLHVMECVQMFIFGLVFYLWAAEVGAVDQGVEHVTMILMLIGVLLMVRDPLGIALEGVWEVFRDVR